MLLFSADDINPNSIILEVFNCRSLFSLLPTSDVAIYIFKNIVDMAMNIRVIASELNAFKNFEYSENNLCRVSIEPQDYDVLEKRAKILAINCSEEESIKKVSKNIVRLFTNDEIYDITLMKEWIKNQEVQNFLLRFLDASRSNQIVPNHLNLFRDKEVIVQAINAINGNWVQDY